MPPPRSAPLSVAAPVVDVDVGCIRCSCGAPRALFTADADLPFQTAKGLVGRNPKQRLELRLFGVGPLLGAWGNASHRIAPHGWGGNVKCLKPSLTPLQNPRESLGPEDEELYAGRSLALYPFEPENSNELRLREGQVIMVSYRHGQGWLVAEDPESGEQGLVPEEYVRLLSELPHFDERTGEFLETETETGEEGGEGEGHEDAAGRRGAVAGHGQGGEHEGGATGDGQGDGEGGEKEKDTRVDTPEAYELEAGNVPSTAETR
ncbi:HOG (high osmolarity glycerol) pathway protein [Friedmanniomyces endolithicus]|nr:HOG (high osmolarity glycerol) pathway protein [Friedmanniomyces endolithicus]KAK1017951.1 HOG (high osmolarity glycerol) pathway protein [Friedmanniomyces endolithicus]